MAANSANSFADRDEKLFRLNIDLRMEQIRQNSVQYNFDHFQSILKRNLKEKKIVADTSDDLKTDLQKAVNYLNEHDVEDEEDCRVLDNIKELASLLKLSSVSKSEGFDLTGDSMCLQVNTDGRTVNGCFVSYVFDSEPKESEITRRCLQQNQVEEIASSFRKMLDLIPDGVQINGSQLHPSATLQVLTILENDIVEMKKRASTSNESQQVNTYALEHCFSRTEVYPLTVVLLEGSFLRNILRSSSADESLVLYDRLIYSAHLCLEKTDVLNFFPSKSFLGNNKTGWTEELPNSLPVEYCLRFSRPVLLSRSNFKAIDDLEGVTSVKVLSKINLFRHLSGCYQDSIRLNCAVSQEVLQQHEMTDFSNLNSEDVIVTEVRLIHPKNLTLILQILRVQLLHNALFESLCHRPNEGQMSVRGKSPKINVRCTISSVNSSIFNLSCSLGEMIVTVKLSIINGLMKVDTTCDDAHSRLLSQFGSVCEDSLKSTHSIPLLIHLISTQIQDKFLQLGIPISRQKQHQLKEDSEDEDNQFDNVNIRSSTCLLPNSSVGKTGQSWLFVDHKITTSTQQIKHTTNKKRQHTFVVLKEQDSNSLLRSIKHVGLVKELIPAPSTLSHTNNTNSFGLPRHLSSGHLPRPQVSDGGMPRRSTETTQATLNYAFSDLEAIAEMGVADDAESVMSETHSNMSILDCSPSASGQQQGGDKSGTRQRRLMQQQQHQQSGQQSNLQNSEVFDFRADNEQGMQHMQVQLDNAWQAVQPVPFTPSSSGRRRGRGRKGGNSGDRMPSMDVSELPESPEYMIGQTRKSRGAAGTPTQRRARKSRKPSNVGSEQNYMVPGYAGGERPLLQRSFSKQSANYVASPNEDMQMKLEMEFCYDYSSDEETDPPPPRTWNHQLVPLRPIDKKESNLVWLQNLRLRNNQQQQLLCFSHYFPSPQEASNQKQVTASESSNSAPPAGKTIKMEMDAAEPSSSSNRETSLASTTKSKPPVAARKPSVQHTTTKLVDSAKSMPAATPSANSFLDLYDNELDSGTSHSKPDPPPKLVQAKEAKVKAVMGSSKPAAPREKTSSSNLKDTSKDQIGRRKSSKSQKNDDTLKVVLKLPKVASSGGGKGEGAKYSSSSSPPPALLPQLLPHRFMLLQLLLAILSQLPLSVQIWGGCWGSAAPTTTSSQKKVFGGAEWRRPKKKLRKEASGLGVPSGSASNKSSSSKDGSSKASKKSSLVASTTTPAIGSEYSSLVNTPSKFMSLKNFKIPKVVESETAPKAEPTAQSQRPNPVHPSPRGISCSISPSKSSHVSTPQDQSFLQRRPSKSILKNSAPHPAMQQQQQMGSNYRGQTPQNRKALLPSPQDNNKRPSPRPSALPTPTASSTNSFQGSWPVVGAQKAVAASGYTPAKDWAFPTTQTDHQPEQDSVLQARQDNSPSQELRICDEDE
uniref:Mediator complex subunit 1 n=1 Tax=Ditylenchus dipsaci TaxID=166011 RepID=A0A915CQ95_9BILA